MAITLFQALLLACTASASILTPRAVCDAKNGLACPSEGIMGCEKNGGHSVSYQQSRQIRFSKLTKSRCDALKMAPVAWTGHTVTTALLKRRTATVTQELVFLTRERGYDTRHVTRGGARKLTWFLLMTWDLISQHSNKLAYIEF